MFVLVLIACMTFDDRTSCQEFPRDYPYASERSCERAGAIEEGRYAARRGARRSWLRYSWACRDAAPPVRHNRGRPAR